MRRLCSIRYKMILHRAAKLFLWVVLCIFCVATLASSMAVDTNDWLKNAFRKSHTVDLYPYASDIEADDLFNSNVSWQGLWNIIEGWWDAVAPWEESIFDDSVFVRAARFLMRIAVMLAIALFIYGWIKIALSLWDTAKLKDALKHIWFVALWIVLILSSVAIIFLITSLTRNSLQLFWT